MTVTLTDEQYAALVEAKKQALEIEKTVADSLSIQNVGGYVIRNQALKLNANLEVVLPTEVAAAAPVEATAKEVILPNE